MYLVGEGAFKSPIHFFCILHAKREGVQIACKIVYSQGFLFLVFDFRPIYTFICPPSRGISAPRPFGPWALDQIRGFCPTETFRLHSHFVVVQYQHSGGGRVASENGVPDTHPP